MKLFLIVGLFHDPQWCFEENLGKSLNLWPFVFFLPTQTIVRLKKKNLSKKKKNISLTCFVLVFTQIVFLMTKAVSSNLINTRKKVFFYCQ